MLQAHFDHEPFIALSAGSLQDGFVASSPRHLQFCRLFSLCTVGYRAMAGIHANHSVQPLDGQWDQLYSWPPLP
jgi:hypothetical protein